VKILYFELKITTMIKQSVHHLEMLEHIGNWISYAQLADTYFKDTHYDRSYKHFVFSNLYPLEKDGVYQRGRVYILTIRSSSENILNRIHSCMKNCRENEYFQLIASEQRTKRVVHISKMITINPAIVTINKKPWLHENNIELLLQQLHANAEKKFKSLYPDEQMQGFQSFIQGIVVENRKPMAIHYKKCKLLGNKLRLFINEDEYSQKLAHVVLGSGLGEKSSSLGAGFCLAK
jgi:CRISPR-associated endoribonuclease Cas6